MTHHVEHFLRKGIITLHPYVPGKSEEEVQETYQIPRVVKLASNENPFPPPEGVLRAIQEEIPRIHRYPDGKCRRLAPRLAEFLGVSPDELIFGNGAEELIFLVCQTFLNEGEEAIIVANCFDAYETAVRVLGGIPVFSSLTSDFHVDLADILRRITPKTKLIFLPNPNNPTGTIFLESSFLDFLDALPEGVLVVLDEAYHEYVTHPEYPDSLRLLGEGHPLIILRTFSKFYGLAGIRIGYAVSQTTFIRVLHHVRQPFNVNRLAETAAIACLDHVSHYRRQAETIQKEKEFLYRSFEKMDLSYIPSHTNFILIDIGKDVRRLFPHLLSQGVIVRPGTIWGLHSFIRVTIGTHDENVAFLQTLSETLQRQSPL